MRCNFKFEGTGSTDCVIYGSEIWNNLKNQDISNLNRFKHFIVKHIQRFKISTRSDICESRVGLRPIITEIDKRKLLFLGKTIHYTMDSIYMTKQIFSVEIIHYVTINLYQIWYLYY
jgi:hypothetical protein